MSKDVLRSQLLTLRDELSPAHREAFNQRISEYLIEMLPMRPLRIGSYMAYGSEVNLDIFHRQVFGGANELLIPRILSKTTMEMVIYQQDADLIIGRFGIRTSKQRKVTELSALDWLIMPCCGFDRRGHRLGMGGGFYDRALDLCPPSSPIRIGVAYGAQETQFEPEHWDQSLDWIITEDGFIRQ
jgi:5-formyltetrahydrofolate cyclo-ligase